MYQQVIEAIAVFASHGNSGGSAPWEINLVQKLCDWDIISPLRFTDDEWSQISSDGTCQNRRKSNVFKEPSKTKENNAERLKGVMLDAVIAYGDLGKSGNKVINLVDSKLYTKNSKCVEIDENLNQIFIDLVLEHLQSLWDNDMIDSNFSFSRDVLLEQINDKFTERYPEQSARLREETGGYFTLDDLDCIKVKFEIEKPIGDLANKINFDLLNTFFNHQHEMTRSSSINKTTMKNILNDGRDISIAKLVENTSLIIK